MQIYMNSTDWLKGIIHEDSSGMESSPSPVELIQCPGTLPPVVERRPLRPQHDQALKCPRCDSTHTKFCYYNNYSLSQPRYFCKTCRRYWTKGGSIRNVPVGGGCRKNKRPSSKKPAEPHHIQPISPFPDATDLQLSFPGEQLPQLSLLTTETPSCNFNYTECKYSSMLGGLHLFMNNDQSNVGLQLGESSHAFSMTSSGIFQGTNRLAYSEVSGKNGAALMEDCQSLFPFEVNQDESSALPNCHDQCCTADAAQPQSMVYSSRLESWLE